MSEWTTCPACGGEVHNSHAGWTRHTESPRHMLVMMGLSVEEADRISRECADAGIAYETAIAALRYALTRPPGDLARMASQLHQFAARLGGSPGGSRTTQEVVGNGPDRA